MNTSRRAFIGGAATAAGLSLLPAPAFAAISRDKTYGVIEISTSGMTVSVYRFNLETIAAGERLSGFERLAPQRTGKPYSVLVSPLGPDADAAQIAESVDTVAGYIRSLKADFNLADRDIAVLISSGVADYSPERVANFTGELRAKTGFVADVVSVRDEARLAFDWIVPRDRRDKVLHFDIGSGNTKGGYYDRRDRRGAFHELSVPYGTKTMAGAVKLRWPPTRTADFGPRSTEFYGDTLAPVLEPQIEAAPLAAERPQLCMTGGIVWASTVILQPGAIARREPWVTLAPDHFATLLKLIEDGTPYGGPLPASLTEDQRKTVLETLEAVRNTFNPHQLAAGAAIGDGLSKQLHFAEREQLYFASFANNTWASQYLIEKFS
ncbi:MAG: hypothetical protein J7483_11345 [Novosphingobium sp.]|nr:hypothetical protein [Novosphingobium sp.]